MFAFNVLSSIHGSVQIKSDWKRKKKIISNHTFEASAKRVSGTDAAAGFAPAQTTLLVDNEWNETFRKSITCFQKF